MTGDDLGATGDDARPCTVLHVSPHPDDETLGAGPALAVLSAAGWRVVNLACSMGRPEDHERRSRELGAALTAWGFVDERLDPPADISSGDDLPAARRRLAGAVTDALDRHRPDLVLSPQTRDGHHGHEVVAAAVHDALTARAAAAATPVGGNGHAEQGAASGPEAADGLGLGDGADAVGDPGQRDGDPGPRDGEPADPPGVPRWWMWGLWRDIDRPTLYVPFGAMILARVDRALVTYAGELVRNDFTRVPVARGSLGAVLGWERVFGYGSQARTGLPYADLLTEVVWRDGGWRLGAPRVLDAGDPFTEPSEEAWALSAT